MFTKAVRIILIYVITATVPVYAGQELVQTKGIGVAESKSKACELGLDQARREAAQQATSMVEASFTSIENDKGVAHRSDQLVTTKAFAKLVDKNEKASFDEETGHISCEVSASFKAGFVNQDVESIKRTDQIEISTSDFKAGEPFCSKVMGMCFREIYSKQLDEFGIQILPTNKGLVGHNSGLIKGAFFSKARSDSNKVVKVTTKEKLIKLLKELNSDEMSPIYLYVNLYRLDSKHGFKQDTTSAGSNGLSLVSGLMPPAIPFRTPKASKEQVSALDDEMKLIQENLDSMY